jgi:hypothetical protein
MVFERRRIFVVYLVYGSRYIDEGIDLLEQIVTKAFPGMEARYLVVDNADCTESDLISTALNRYYVSGDNKLREFSGWDKGWKLFERNFAVAEEDLFLFANDTFFRRVGKVYLKWLEEVVSNNNDYRVYGYLEDFPRDVEILGLRYRWWIRSNIFILAASVMRTLGSLCFPMRSEFIFSNLGDRFWRDDAPISENWRAYISCWLFGEQSANYPEYNLKWYAAERLSECNRDAFINKCMCILSEHWLAARINHLQVGVGNFNKLPLSPDRHTAPYYEQQLV